MHSDQLNARQLALPAREAINPPLLPPAAQGKTVRKEGLKHRHPKKKGRHR